MAAPFERTTRALAQDTSLLAWAAWGVAALLLAAWLSWFIGARVTVYEVSQTARVEVQQSAHPVAAPVDALVLDGSALQLGQAVRAGQVLLRLDARREAARLNETQAKLSAVPARIGALQREVAALQAALVQDQQTAAAAADAAQARQREAEAALAFARDNEKRLRADGEAGGVPAIDALRASADTRQREAAAQALLAEQRRFSSEAQGRQRQQQAQLDNLGQTLATLQGEQAALQAEAQRLQQEIALYSVRAPVDGVLGDAPALRAGSRVTAGQTLATVLPPGGLRIVAEFSPAAALGRIHVGQTAQLRLDGFPWTEFGVIPARVSRVAGEVREQRVRVELSAAPSEAQQALLQHGLPGRVDVSVDSASPATLVLRAAGQVGATPSPRARADGTAAAAP